MIIFSKSIKKVLLTTLIALLLFNFHSSEAVAKCFQVDSGGTLTTNLYSYYQLEDITDFYSTRNLQNNSSAAFIAGKVNNAFNATSSAYLSDASSTSDFDFLKTQAFSLAAWEKKTAAGTKVIVTKQNFDINDGGYSLDILSGGQAQFFIADTSGANHYIYIQTTSTSYGDGNWHFVVGTYDGTAASSGMKLYVDNLLQNGVTGGSLSVDITNTYPFQIGNDQSGAYKWGGEVDEVGVWKKVLSTTEISDLYNSGSGQTMTTTCAATAVPRRVAFPVIILLESNLLKVLA